ncbi:MAG: hypothetical protein ACTHU0_28775 [Kofleriaceae bacterium]
MVHPASTRSLSELPIVARNALGFLAVANGLGFSDALVSFGTMRSPMRRGEMVACAKLFVDGKGFALGLGPPTEELDAWVARAKELWIAASRAERTNLLASLSMFGRQGFMAIASGISAAGITLHESPWSVYARLEGAESSEVLDRQPGFDGRPWSPR